MVPQEPRLCRQLFCFTAITIVLPTQRAQLNPIPLAPWVPRPIPSMALAASCGVGANRLQRPS